MVSRTGLHYNIKSHYNIKMKANGFSNWFIRDAVELQIVTQHRLFPPEVGWCY